jgi:hypothetical protein
MLSFIAYVLCSTCVVKGIPQKRKSLCCFLSFLKGEEEEFPVFECFAILLLVGIIFFLVILNNKIHLSRFLFVTGICSCCLCGATFPIYLTYSKVKKRCLAYQLSHFPSITIGGIDGYYNVHNYLNCKAALQSMHKHKWWKKKQSKKPVETIRLAGLHTQQAHLAHVLSQPIPTWIQDLVNEELSYYAIYPCSADALKATLAEYQSFGEGWEETGQLALFSIRQGTLFVKDYSNKHARLEDVSAALDRLCRSAFMPDLDFLVSFHDHLENKPAHAPIFVFSKKRLNKKMILIPDHEHLMGYDDLNKTIDEASERSPWDTKEDLAFWRGGTSGGVYTDSNWTSFPRVKLTLISSAHPELLDAKFSLLVQGSRQHQEFLTQHHLIAPILYPQDQLRYRYLIDVDGNASTYSRFYWILRSNCTPIKQTSSFMQWYYPLLVPYQHYIPVQEDLSDLEEQLHWTKAHNDQARVIAETSSRFAKDYLNIESTYLYLYALLLKYKACFSDEKQF